MVFAVAPIRYYTEDGKLDKNGQKNIVMVTGKNVSDIKKKKMKFITPIIYYQMEK